MKLDIGSGHIFREGFQRVDADPDVNAHYECLVENIEDDIEHDTVEEIYTAHCLEHIGYSDCFNVLRSFWRILKPGGLITIIVPDVEYAIEKYVGDHNWSAFEKIVIGSDPDATEWMVHRNIFCTGKLQRLLTITGFTSISHNETPDSEIITIRSKKPEEDVNA